MKYYKNKEKRGQSPEILDKIRDNILPKSLDYLSNNECQIKYLSMIAMGLTDEDISIITHLSTQTTKWHLGKIYDELNTINRTDSVIQAISNGILDINKINVLTNSNDKSKYTVEKLSIEEKNNLIYIGAGCSNIQIANIKGVSLSCIKKQMENTFRKLNVGDKTAAVILSIQKKEINLDEILKTRKNFEHEIKNYIKKRKRYKSIP